MSYVGGGEGDLEGLRRDAGTASCAAECDWRKQRCEVRMT
jgi:hypothetical protein